MNVVEGLDLLLSVRRQGGRGRTQRRGQDEHPQGPGGGDARCGRDGETPRRRGVPPAGSTAASRRRRRRVASSTSSPRGAWSTCSGASRRPASSSRNTRRRTTSPASGGSRRSTNGAAGIAPKRRRGRSSPDSVCPRTGSPCPVRRALGRRTATARAGSDPVRRVRPAAVGRTDEPPRRGREGLADEVPRRLPRGAPGGQPRHRAPGRIHHPDPAPRPRRGRRVPRDLHAVPGGEGARREASHGPSPPGRSPRSSG